MRSTEGALHLWIAHLDRCPSPDAGTLRAEELQRARRIVDERRRSRWIAARAFLRMLLGAYLQAHPESLRFDVSAHGKPHLAAASGESRLRFNLSHSGHLALCALTRTCPVGVDVQLAPRRPELLAELATRVFGAERANRLRSLPVHIRNRELLAAWTELEAERKLTGAGLARGGPPGEGIDRDEQMGANRGAMSAGSSFPCAQPSDPRIWIERMEVAHNCAASVALALPPSQRRLCAWRW